MVHSRAFAIGYFIFELSFEVPYKYFAYVALFEVYSFMISVYCTSKLVVERERYK